MIFSFGFSARIRTSNAARRPVAAAAVGDGVCVFDVGNLDQLLGDERARERRGHRRAIVEERVGLERRQHEVVRERLAQIEDVRAHGADGERAIADRFELAPLPEVHRDRDDVGVVVFLQPRNGDRGVEPPEYARTMRSTFRALRTRPDV